MKETKLPEFWKRCSTPERVVWAVSEYEGQRTICPLGWKMRTSFAPPMMAISVGHSRFSHDLITQSKEFVLAWPGEDLADATLLCGTRSGRDLDKFAETGLTPLPGRHVRAPLVKECVANLECRLAGAFDTGDHTIFAGEVLSAWMQDTPGRLLCSVGHLAGYDFLLEAKGYRFGVVKH